MKNDIERKEKQQATIIENQVSLCLHIKHAEADFGLSGACSAADVSLLMLVWVSRQSTEATH